MAYHTPIMLKEIIEFLNVKPGGQYLDCTLGGGGHSEGMLKKMKGSGILFGIDQDEDAISECEKRFSNFENKKLIRDNFKNAKQLLKNEKPFDGILMDLGISSHQIDEGDRGFSFLRDAKLDMRMDQRQKFSALDLVNSYSEERLLEILYKYGEENFARNIVRNIISARKEKPIETTFELKNIIENSIPKKILYTLGGASKKTFQAIRIEVNNELGILEDSVRDAIDLLAPGGRLCVMTFHSLEDRIVKNLFREEATECICPPRIPQCICGHKARVKLITRKPVTASEEEQKKNTRSTSAKLRVVEKI